MTLKMKEIVMNKNRCITHARVTVASLVDTSIAELQACPEEGQMYNYIAYDDILASKVILEADQHGMKKEVLHHMFSPCTKGILQIDKVIN